MSRNSASVLCFSSLCVYAILSSLSCQKPDREGGLRLPRTLRSRKWPSLTVGLLTLFDLVTLKYHVTPTNVERTPQTCTQANRPSDGPRPGARHLRGPVRSLLSTQN